MTASTISATQPLPRQTRAPMACSGSDRCSARTWPNGPTARAPWSSLVVTAAFMALTAANSLDQHLAHRQPAQ